MCQLADDATAFLPYDEISASEYQPNEIWETDLLDCKNPLFVGVDVGRERDLTVIWLIEQVGGINFTRRVIEMSKETFDAQEQALYELLRLPMVRRCCIDQSGLGRQFAERAGEEIWRVPRARHLFHDIDEGRTGLSGAGRFRRAQNSGSIRSGDPVRPPRHPA
jgi:hypothetical protein